MLDSAIGAWFVLTTLSAAYVAWDSATNNPELRVMKWGWLLVTLYTGPIGAAAYVLTCQEPAPGAHAACSCPVHIRFHPLRRRIHQCNEHLAGPPELWR